MTATTIEEYMEKADKKAFALSLGKKFLMAVVKVVTILWFTSVLLLNAANFYMSSNAGKQSAVSERMYKTCMVRLPNGDTVEGERRIKLSHYVFFDKVQITPRDSIVEETFLRTGPDGVMVIGHDKNGQPKSKWVKPGQSAQLIDNADDYTFVVGQEVASIPYTDFCK